MHQLRSQANEVAEVAAAAALDWEGHIPTHPSSDAHGGGGDVLTSSSGSYRGLGSGLGSGMGSGLGLGSGGFGSGTGGATSYGSSGYNSGATPSYKSRGGNNTMTTTMNSTSSSSMGNYIPSHITIIYPLI